MEVMQKVRIGISSCLLGKRVRYDAGLIVDPYIKETLGQYFEWVPVCPEVEYGLPVPREPMHLAGDPSSPRLVTVHSGVDHTGGMIKWAGKRLRELEPQELCGFVFKSKSPSSGMEGVKVYTDQGMFVRGGTGIFAKEFMEHFPLVPVTDDSRLNRPGLRENFIERVFVFKRWSEYLRGCGSVRDLIEFHAAHKLLILSHSPKHLVSLGRLVANSKRHTLGSLRSEYIRTLTEALHLLSTVRKNTNVLLHIAGYFKRKLAPEDKRELFEVIEDYHKGYVPLIVPITLIKHYVRKFDEPYLGTQYYLNPHPLELMLKNHG